MGGRGRIAIGLGILIGLVCANEQASAGQAGTSAPLEAEAASFSVSAPARALATSPATGEESSAPPPRVNPLGSTGPDTAAPPDPLAGDSSARGRTPTPSLVFAGSSNPVACGGCTPPDTTADVGSNHVIQMVNATKVAIFSKTGTPSLPPFDLSTLWAATPADPCFSDLGDPQVNYDELADRWVLSQFYDDGATTGLCFAVSQTADPTGSYFLYRFVTPDFPDYFKVGVWPTGYYVSTNESSYAAYALDRTKMLAGTPTASSIRFPGETNFLMPADVTGTVAPPTQGGLFYTFKDDIFHGGADRIEVSQLTPDFTTPANSTFAIISTIPIASFKYTVCGFFNLDCIPQPSTVEGLDAVSEWPMQRLAYRRFAGHEALVGDFTVGVPATANRAGGAIRWFELRKSGATWTLFQEGTFDPDNNDRFMGSPSIDQDGNIAIGYTVSSTTTFPSIRYATRAPSDPPGTLQAEQTMQAGGGSQTSTFNRWGDYSAMSIDPVSGCDFWYTNEFYSATATNSWKTSIGKFTMPGCGGGPVNRTLTVAKSGTGTGTVTGTGINCGADCTETVPDGTVVTLTASPDAGSTFTGWSGGGCSGTGPCDVTLDADKTVSATFTANPVNRTLTVAKSGTGTGTVAGTGINCGADCTETVPDGTVVTLTASPDAGSTFTGWSGGGCSGTGPCDVTLDADKTVTATFVKSGPPSNSFTLGAPKRKPNGTATLPVTVPGPGELTLGGNGIKAQRPGANRARARKPVTAAGTVQLKIKATGAKNRKLKATGRVKVKAKITFTPTGGTPNTQIKKVKLRLGR